MLGVLIHLLSPDMGLACQHDAALCLAAIRVSCALEGRPHELAASLATPDSVLVAAQA